MYRDKFAEDPLYKVVCYDGIPKTLKELKRQGVKLAVCSNKPHPAAVKVIDRMFGKEFDLVIGQSDAVPRKPAPDGALLAAEKFGVKPEECMYIGDTGTDMKTGKAAGMYTVGALWGFRDAKELTENGADVLAEKPVDLLGLFEEKIMIKLVASDLDGTLLLNGAQDLKESLFPLIRRLREMGILFVAASGRQYANMKRLFLPVANEIAFVCENGGMAIDQEEVLYQDAFDPELAREILETIYAKDGAEFSCSTKDFYYMRSKSDHYTDLMLNVVKNVCKSIDSFDEMTEPCMKIAVYERGGMQEDSIRYWRERFADRCTVVTSGGAWVDFIPFGTNKAKGIRMLQERFGILPEECIAFGDEYNDIEMLKSVKYGFAMEHAKPGVLASAPHRAADVEQVLTRLIQAGGKIEEVL